MIKFCSSVSIAKPKKKPVATPSSKPAIDCKLTENPIKKKEGERFEASFKISGQPAPDVFFYKDEQQLEDSEHVSIKHEGFHRVFTIENLVAADSGVYVVEAENKEGLVEKEFQIDVTCTCLFLFFFSILYDDWRLDRDFVTCSEAS